MFDAGAIVGKLTLDKSQWNSTVSLVQKDQDKMKAGFQSFAQSFKENWIAVTAAVAAGMIAVNKAWSLMELGAKAKQVEDGFMGIANSAGIAGDRLKQAVLEASAYTANFSDIASSMSSLIGHSLDPNQIVALMQVARAEARKTGEDVQTVFNTISSSVSAGFTRTLRTAYGLNVDVTIAIENYARQTGLTKDQVERFYKAQAIANEVLKQANRDLTALNGSGLTHYERIQQIKAAWDDFKEKLGVGIFNIATIIGSLAGMVFSSLLGTIDMIVQGVAKILSFIPGLKKAMSEVSDFWKQKSQANANAIAAYWQDMVASIKDMSGQTKNTIADTLSYTQIATEENTRVIKQTYSDWLNDTKQNFNAMLLVGQSTFSSLQTFFSDTVYNGFKGMVSNMSEVFTNFGNSILRMLADIAAQWVAMQIMMGITKAVGSIAGIFTAGAGTITGGVGGYNTGIQAAGGQSFPTWSPYPAGFAEGIDYVPSTGNYKLHEGEEVVPKYDAGKNRELAITIVNQITPSFVNSAIASEPETVINVINADNLRNGVTRKTYRRAM